MQTLIFCVYYVAILLAAIIGLARYRDLSTALRFIVILLTLTVISESASYILVELKEYGIRYTVFHIYNILQLVLVSLYFIYAIKPYHYRKLVLVACILCPLIGILNIIYLQPIDKLNNYMLMVESLAINAMSLYYIYWLIKRHATQNLFKLSHFQITLSLLTLWSTTFFFWSLIPILDDYKWNYLNLATYIQATINILVYSRIGITIYKVKLLDR